MSQRYVCPWVGALGRPLMQRVATSSRCWKGFHASARRLEEQRGNSSPAGSESQREPRRQRMANAAAQIGELQSRRPRSGAPQTGGAPSSGPKIIAPKKPLVRKGPNSPPGPPGTMVRAPSKFRTTRQAGPPGTNPAGAGPSGQPRGGPNLRARGGAPGKGGPKNRGSEAGPRKRERSAGGSSDGESMQVDQDVVEGRQIDRSTMKLLYQMQREQWDRKPYTPKYAPGSFEANELIHAGRELFRGEAPPVKVWGKLERTLNIVGMHGAAAKLEVRRVPDGDHMPFGQEHENLLLKQDNAAAKKAQEIAA